MFKLHTILKALYHGNSVTASRFRFTMLGLDIVIILYFIAASMVPDWAGLVYVDALTGVILLFDFAARIWVADMSWRYALTLSTFIDVLIIASLLLPIFFQNLAFLRVIRALRLLRSYHVLKDLRGHYAFFARHEDIIQSVLNLFVFIFFITALVYVMQVSVNDQINNYVDALYFTVTTLTTTGFGDITLQGESGHLLSVIIMVVGVGLFLRLVQTIFHPTKVKHPCPQCGLMRHDPDAVHCKHCGIVLNIETRGG